MQTVNVRGAWRADKTAQVCLWAKVAGVGEVFVVSGETVRLPLTAEVSDAIGQGRLVVVEDETTAESEPAPEPEIAQPEPSKPAKRSKA